MTETRYKRLLLALKYYMIGKGYVRGVKALEYARGIHTGIRKDQVTPEFQHQVEIGLFITTLKSLVDEENTLIVAMLHDIVEDHDVSLEVITSMFSAEIAEAVDRLTKYPGLSDEVYYENCASHHLSSIVKGCDRIHNVNTMNGVFDRQKKDSYLQEVELFILPMIKESERLFPEQFLSYMNIKHMLKSQINLIRGLL